jgi:hypothetical protein
MNPENLIYTSIYVQKFNAEQNNMAKLIINWMNIPITK